MNSVDEVFMEMGFEKDFSGLLDFKRKEDGSKYVHSKTHMFYCIWRKGFLSAEKVFSKENNK